MEPDQMNVEVENNNAAANQNDVAPTAGEQDFVAPATPHQSPPAANIEPVNEDPIAAISALLARLIDNFDDIIPRIGGKKFINVGCQLTETKGQEGTVRQLTLQFNTFGPNEELQDNEVNMLLNSATLPGPSKNQKKQKKAPRDVSTVRCRKRIADLTHGFINSKSAAAEVEGKCKDDVEPEDSLHLEASVIDHNAAPPPHLPLSTVQVIGTSHCRMPPTAVSEDVMNYVSSNDSV
jgi:hypothetical protein